MTVTVVVDEVLAGSSCRAGGPSSDSWPLEPIMKSISCQCLTNTRCEGGASVLFGASGLVEQYLFIVTI